MGQEERDNHQEKETEQIKEMGALELDKDREKHRIQLLTIIGEIEGHEAVSGNTKATKYEHLLPKLLETNKMAHLTEDMYSCKMCLFDFLSK